MQGAYFFNGDAAVELERRLLEDASEALAAKGRGRTRQRHEQGWRRLRRIVDRSWRLGRRWARRRALSAPLLMQLRVDAS